MDVNWIEALVYGIVSGLTEFLPISSHAHRMILMNLFGISDGSFVLNLFVHIGMIAGLVVTSGGYIKRLFKEYQLSKTARRRRKRELNMQSVFDIHFVKTAFIPVLISLLLYIKTMQWGNTVPIVALFLLLNGIILFIPMYLPRGNKDSRNMSSLDSILFGVGSAIAILPGVSRIGAGCSVAIARGADPQHAYKWSLILSVPVLLALLCFDVFSIFAVGLDGVGLLFLLKCIMSGAFSFLGASLAIALMKALTVRTGISGFSYYSWGAALFIFILYLY